MVSDSVFTMPGMQMKVRPDKSDETTQQDTKKTIQFRSDHQRGHAFQPQKANAVANSKCTRAVCRDEFNSATSELAPRPEIHPENRNHDFDGSGP